MNSLLAPHFRGTNVLVTGGMGFIGSNLALDLLAQGANVAVIDSLHPGCGGNLFNLEPVKSEITFHEFDLSDPGRLKNSRLVHPNLDYVFSLAGNVSHVDSMSDPLADLQMNAFSELALLQEILRSAPNARVVHTGTRQIYGRPLYSPVDENHPVHPTDINGIHKHCAEQYHRMFYSTYGLRTTILRLTNTYGPRQMIRRSGQGVAGAFLGNALRGETLKLFDGGEQKRDFTYVMDVVEALQLAATQTGCIGQTYNLAGPVHTLREFAEELVLQNPGLSFINEPFPEARKKIDIGDFSGSAEKFRQATGWEPKTSLGLGIEKTLDYFRPSLGRYV